MGERLRKNGILKTEEKVNKIREVVDKKKFRERLRKNAVLTIQEKVGGTNFCPGGFRPGNVLEGFVLGLSCENWFPGRVQGISFLILFA